MNIIHFNKVTTTGIEPVLKILEIFVLPLHQGVEAHSELAPDFSDLQTNVLLHKLMSRAQCRNRTKTFSALQADVLTIELTGLSTNRLVDSSSTYYIVVLEFLLPKLSTNLLK